MNYGKKRYPTDPEGNIVEFKKGGSEEDWVRFALIGRGIPKDKIDILSHEDRLRLLSLRMGIEVKTQQEKIDKIKREERLGEQKKIINWMKEE